MSLKEYRNQYIIGDVQGCFAQLQSLLNKIEFNAKKDCLWFAGDLVARGENSLSTLKFIKQLNETGHAYTVLGNHDLNLLAVWRGFVPAKEKDNTANIFEDKECDNLMNWLRKQPLIHQVSPQFVLCHAGIPPIWSTQTAFTLSNEVHQHLAGDIKKLDKLLPKLYGKHPNIWADSLAGYERLRCITNYLTRMRICSESGQLEFKYKMNPDKFKNEMPNNFKPWYEWHNQITQKRKETIVFGHWAALEAQIETDKVIATDAGCVWGGKLKAFRINDGKTFYK